VQSVHFGASVLPVVVFAAVHFCLLCCQALIQRWY